MNADCLFCKIAAREIPAKFVHEDAELVAFRDIAPQAPTHILIIPREHIATLNDLSEQHAGLIGQMTMLAQRLARQEGVAEEGYRLVFNCNAGAGQSVWHVHMHLLGGRPMRWPPG